MVAESITQLVDLYFTLLHKSYSEERSLFDYG